MSSTPLPENMPPALYVDGHGYVWQDSAPPGWLSMVRINPDNSPIPFPLVRYEPVAVQQTAVHESVSNNPSRPERDE